MPDLSVQDELLPVSWRSRRGDFISLMTLYESNYVRLRRLIPDLYHVPDAQVSEVAGDCRLHLKVEERSPYTTTFTLTYLFETPTGTLADPDLHIRIYHDAHLAEVLRCARWHRHDVLAGIKSDLHSQMSDRWLRNIMLNKWLDYCTERGHLFSTSARNPLLT